MATKRIFYDIEPEIHQKFKDMAYKERKPLKDWIIEKINKCLLYEQKEVKKVK